MKTVPDEVDGRRLRRVQNRHSVLDALIELYGEGALTPSTDEIARRAGISPRSLFRYFDDVEDLNRAAIERALGAARPLLDLSVDAAAPTERKIGALVEARLLLFETIAPAARAARANAHRHPEVQNQIHEARSFLRHQIAKLFAAELRDVGTARLPAIDALCSFETYDLLRREQGQSRAKLAATLTTALVALLTPAGGRP